jgi:phenylacetate-CoA ligase
LPMVFSFDPLRTFIEVIDPDRTGYGRVTVSMLDPSRMLPLLRYQTGDIGRLLDRSSIEAAMLKHGVAVPDEMPDALLALRGRDSEQLPNGWHVGLYKEALYANHQAARCLTGAFRVTCCAGRTEVHVQLGQSQTPRAFIDQAILTSMAPGMRPDRLVTWPYECFPFGMRLDYERKFSHFRHGEPDPVVDQCRPSVRELTR